jgi:hypothetical protein
MVLFGKDEERENDYFVEQLHIHVACTVVNKRKNTQEQEGEDVNN